MTSGNDNMTFSHSADTVLHYITVHYTTVPYTTVHYTTVHYTAQHYTPLHYTPLHYNVATRFPINKIFPST